MKLQPCLYLLLSVLPFLLLADGVRVETLLGGWEPIKDVKDPHVIEIGKFAVSEHNKQSESDLEFQSVVKGESQVVAGTNYRLIVEAKDGKASRNYEAVVWEKVWAHFMNLTSFKPVTG